MQVRVRPTAIISGLAALLGLILVTWHEPAVTVLTPVWALFCALITFASVVGVPIAGGSVSLLPMLSVASYLVLGLVPAAWAAFCAAVLNGGLRYHLAVPLGANQRPGKRQTLNIVLANATMHSTAILAGGVAYHWLGGPVPLRETQIAIALPLLGLTFVYLLANYLLAGAFMVGWRMTRIDEFFGALKRMLGYEALPMIFAPLTALIYTRIGFYELVLFGAFLVAASLIARNLDRTSQRLKRRLQELDSLQAVGQALSASLKIETVVHAIYQQVRRLMPAADFFVALYNPETDEVSFPLAVENNAPVQWRSRRAGNGLTEYLLRTNKPLLLRNDVDAQVRALGIHPSGKAAQCWLGVPISSGAEPLGVIGIQSYTDPNAYDLSHQQLLTTIASQAAVAIQNARLYERTDQALARRVEELNSILRTTQEGVVLLDPGWRVLAVNRAFSELTGMAQTETTSAPLSAEMLHLLGFTTETCRTDCATLTAGAADRTQATLSFSQPKRALTRTLTPVRGHQETIDGWLIVLRDITEEQKLGELRQDMTNMLVHDLRSPLTVVMGILSLMEETHAEDFEKLRTMALQNCERILKMINELLDISRLESGQMPLHRAPLEVRALLAEVASRYHLLATEAAIALQVDCVGDLPSLSVDGELIQRAMSNLVHNAIKFTPDGGHIGIWARLDDERHPGELLMGVTDDGPGIPVETQTRIFEKFKQPSLTRGRWRGTGLGLAFCKLTAEAHGGRIWVESIPGKGATFTIALPLAR